MEHLLYEQKLTSWQRGVAMQLASLHLEMIGEGGGETLIAYSGIGELTGFDWTNSAYRNRLRVLVRMGVLYEKRKAGLCFWGVTPAMLEICKKAKLAAREATWVSML